MAYLLKIGSLVLPATFSVQKVPMNRNVPSAKTARADGARNLIGFLEARKFSLHGGVVAGDGSIPTGTGSLRDQLDALKAALTTGYTTFQTEDDRQWRACQAESYSDDYDEAGFGHYCEVSFDIVTGDPFSYETQQHTVTQAVGGASAQITANVGGNAYALPQISITAASGAIGLTLTNQTTGEACTLNGLVQNGEILVLDTQRETVTQQQNGSDRMILFDGLFPRLQVGANTLQVNVTSGAVSQVAVAWNGRWY